MSAPSTACEREVRVVIDTQTLLCLDNGHCVRSFDISTAALGTGQQSGSNQTPLGAHIVRAKIGSGEPEGAVFTGRRPTGEIWSEDLHERQPDRDWILTRILWLSGTEPGHNRLGDVDTMRRYIYIHGTPECEPLGQPASHGCVRMHSADVLWLFDWIAIGTPVYIGAQDLRVEEPSELSRNITHKNQLKRPETMPGPIMVDVEGLTLEAHDHAVLEHPLTGGVILFARNFSSKAQVKALIQDIRLVAPQLVIAVDQEGGRVQRFRDEFTRIPPMRVFGQLYTRSPHEAVQRAEDCGWVIGSELREVGVDLNFAPVVDLDYGLSDVIGDRAFSSDADTVIKLAAAFMGGMHSAGISSCIKHFPGHGFVTADSHLELPVDNRTRAELDVDLRPFEKLLGARSVMTAHLVASCEDQELVSFSTRWVNDILRGEFGFKGVVFSDDLSMKGADCEGGILAKVERALAAGCEFLPVCNDREAVLELYRSATVLKSSPRISSLLAKAAPAHYKTTRRYSAFQEFVLTEQVQHGG